VAWKKGKEKKDECSAKLSQALPSFLAGKWGGTVDPLEKRKGDPKGAGLFVFGLLQRKKRTSYEGGGGGSPGAKIPRAPRKKKKQEGKNFKRRVSTTTGKGREKRRTPNPLSPWGKRGKNLAQRGKKKLVQVVSILHSKRKTSKKKNKEPEGHASFTKSREKEEKGGA